MTLNDNANLFVIEMAAGPHSAFQLGLTRFTVFPCGGTAHRRQILVTFAPYNISSSKVTSVSVSRGLLEFGCLIDGRDTSGLLLLRH